MKSIMISIHPKWCELIASGKKTIEVRKTRPKLDTPFKCYIYCTNKRPFLVWGDIFHGYDWTIEFTHLSGYSRKEAEKIWNIFNGKVMGEFVCNFVDKYCYDYCPHPEIGMDYDCGDNWWGIVDEDLKKLCMTESEFRIYAYPQHEVYGWHISDLEIYGEPRELTDFVSGSSILEITNDNALRWSGMKRPPQSWCYVEERRQTWG